LLPPLSERNMAFDASFRGEAGTEAETTGVSFVRRLGNRGHFSAMERPVDWPKTS
jgi:hypothetical protein